MVYVWTDIGINIVNEIGGPELATELGNPSSGEKVAHHSMQDLEKHGAWDMLVAEGAVVPENSQTNAPAETTGSAPSSSSRPTPQTSPESLLQIGLSDASTHSGISFNRAKRKPTRESSTSSGRHSSEDDTLSELPPGASPSASYWDIARSSVGSIAGLWTVPEASSEPPPVIEEEGSDSGSAASEIADLTTGTSQALDRGAARPHQGRRAAALADDGDDVGLNATFRRVSNFIGDAAEGLWTAAAEDYEPGTSSSSGAGASPSSATLPPRSAFEFDELRKEVRRPFQRLLSDVPEDGDECEVFLKMRGQGSDDEDERDFRSPLLSAVQRSRLIGRVLGCCDAVLCELSQEEAHLWDAFMSADKQLRGSLYVRGNELISLLGNLSRSTDRITSWMEAISVWADDNDEVDFADLLDWFAGEQQKGGLWSFQTSLRSSFSQLLSANTQPSNMRMRPELLTALRNRLAALAPPALARVAASCQRTLILTSWCQCERRLLSLVGPASMPQASREGGRGPPTGLVSALIAVLRGINAELAPTERVLWELLGTKDSNFDGTLDKPEVHAAIGELLVYSIERELETPENEFEELQRLRADCRRRSVESLFQEQRQRKGNKGEGDSNVTLADVLRWWWDMSEEYRVAAGLSVPAALLRRSLHRRPEEMFRDKLPRMAANTEAAKVALKGHSRVLAELRALAVSRALENLHGREPSATTSCTSATSEHTAESKSRDADQDDDEEEDDSPKAATNDPPRVEQHAAAVTAPSAAGEDGSTPSWGGWESQPRRSITAESGIDDALRPATALQRGRGRSPGPGGLDMSDEDVHL